MLDSSTHLSPLAPDELRPALHLITALARADMGVLLLHDEARGQLMPVLAYGMTDAQRDSFGSHRATDGAFGIALNEHRLVRVRNVWRNPAELRDQALALGFRHIELLPFFRSDGRELGIFAILYRSRGATKRRAARLAGECAELVAVALTHAYDHAEAEGARAQIASIAQAKVQFFARMSHELRTPLQSISGYIDLLQAGAAEKLTQDQSKMLSRIAASEQILVHIIDDLLTFSRIETGHMPYDIQPVSAHEAMEGAEALVMPLAAQRKIRLGVANGTPDCRVAADSYKLRQILVNLAMNAIKFTAAGGEVTLSCHCDRDCVCFDVADTGTGIPPDKLSAIFDPYVQLDATPTNGSAGWGLGLAICREFTGGMKGSLAVRSEVGRGSVFTVTLPRASDPQSTDGQARTSGSPRLADPRNHRRRERSLRL